MFLFDRCTSKRKPPIVQVRPRELTVFTSPSTPRSTALAVSRLSRPVAWSQGLFGIEPGNADGKRQPKRSASK